MLYVLCMLCRPFKLLCPRTRKILAMGLGHIDLFILRNYYVFSTHCSYTVAANNCNSTVTAATCKSICMGGVWFFSWGC